MKEIWKKCKKRRILIWCASVLGALALCALVFAVYVGDYYRADLDAIAAFELEDGVTEEEWEDGTVVCAPQTATTGLILYPGGKVEHTAYLPLMRACAARGILCVLVDMPCNLAVLEKNAADGIREKFPEIKHWYIGGHSLGGSMAASYLKKHAEEFEGLILLGSYATANLSDTDLSVLSVYGSEDGVMNRKKYEKYKKNLPDDFTEHVIDGGCHAYFGMYGEQKGDGTPRLTPTEQILRTADIIFEWAKGEQP